MLTRRFASDGSSLDAAPRQAKIVFPYDVVTRHRGATDRCGRATARSAGAQPPWSVAVSLAAPEESDAVIASTAERSLAVWRVRVDANKLALRGALITDGLPSAPFEIAQTMRDEARARRRVHARRHARRRSVHGHEFVLCESLVVVGERRVR